MGIKKLDLTQIQGQLYEFQPTQETPRQYYFLDLYYQTNLPLYKFISSLTGLKKGDKYQCGTDAVMVLEHNPATESTMQSWASKLKWEQRKKDYWRNLYKTNQENRRKKVEAFFGGFTDDLIDSSNKLSDTEDEIDDDFNSKPHLKADGKASIANARTKNLEMLFKLAGIQDTSNMKVDLNADIEAGVETNLKIEDNHALAKAQTILMQPEFVVLNKKIMEKTADELSKQRNSDG